jgi:hypothetical protein
MYSIQTTLLLQIVNRPAPIQGPKKHRHDSSQIRKNQRLLYLQPFDYIFRLDYNIDKNDSAL